MSKYKALVPFGVLLNFHYFFSKFHFTIRRHSIIRLNDESLRRLRHTVRLNSIHLMQTIYRLCIYINKRYSSRPIYCNFRLFFFMSLFSCSGSSYNFFSSVYNIYLDNCFKYFGHNQLLIKWDEAREIFVLSFFF